MRFQQYIRSSVSSESKAATGGTKVFEDHNDDHDNYDPTQFVFSTPKITLLLTRPFKYILTIQTFESLWKLWSYLL